MYLNGKETPTGVRDKPRAHLPVCAGVELQNHVNINQGMQEMIS
uniref:Uncharacterized protein n=1 Tax=Zea mays TaxID=4577 RepID=B4FL41_MAIZE|nr:unknown [Zea mays]